MFIYSLVDIVGATGKGYSVWQEIIDNNVKVKSDTIVEVWKVSLKSLFNSIEEIFMIILESVFR